LKDSYDVIVVGGGPSGSMAAWECAKGGASVCLLEKDRDIGYPVRCGEAAGESGIKQFVDINPNWVAEKITGAVLVAPNEKQVEIKFSSETGYILNRRIFDYDLSRKAALAGAEIFTKAYVKNIIKDGTSGFLVENNNEWFEKLKLLIDDKNLRIKIGANGRKVVENYYSNEMMGKKYLEVLSKVSIKN